MPEKLLFIHCYGVLQVSISNTTSEKNRIRSCNTYHHSFFNLKLIPSVREGAPPDVMQITATTLQDVVIHRARGGTASVTLRSSKQDPLRRLSPREVQGAVCLQLDLTLGFGEVLHDYLRAG